MRKTPAHNVLVTGLVKLWSWQDEEKQKGRKAVKMVVRTASRTKTASGSGRDGSRWRMKGKAKGMRIIREHFNVPVEGLWVLI